jgi:hypothetical protein
VQTPKIRGGNRGALLHLHARHFARAALKHNVRLDTVHQLFSDGVDSEIVELRILI